MGDFSAEWLALRESVDHRARSAGLIQRLALWLTETGASTPLALLDLGAGAGSNLRYSAPLLGGEQHWTCVDQDPELLATLLPTDRGLGPGAGSCRNPRGRAACESTGRTCAVGS